MRTHFLRQAGIRPIQSRLRHRITHPPRPVALRRPRRNAEYRAAAILRDHRRQHILAKQDRPADISRHRPIQQFRIQLGHRRFAVDPRIGHHHIDAPEMPQSFRRQPLQIRGGSNIAYHRQGFPARRRDGPGRAGDIPGRIARILRPRRNVRRRPRRHHHLRPGRPQRQAYFPPNPPAAPGHDRHFPVKRHIRALHPSVFPNFHAAGRK